MYAEAFVELDQDHADFTSEWGHAEPRYADAWVASTMREHAFHIPTPFRGVHAVDLAEKFNALAEEWRADTWLTSSQSDIIMHAAYQRIIGLGPAVLPLLFRELRARREPWFWALYAITGEDPLEAGDEYARIVDKWLEWGRAHGYLP